MRNQGIAYFDRKVGCPMDKKSNALTRKHGKHLRVPVLPSEESTIKQNALNAGLTIAEYLRRLGLSQPIPSKIDKNHIIELSKVNADLGRLGGLLKMWLSNDERLAHFSPSVIKGLLARIATTQNDMFNVVKKL